MVSPQRGLCRSLWHRLTHSQGRRRRDHHRLRRRSAAGLLPGHAPVLGPPRRTDRRQHRARISHGRRRPAAVHRAVAPGATGRPRLALYLAGDRARRRRARPADRSRTFGRGCAGPRPPHSPAAGRGCGRRAETLGARSWRPAWPGAREARCAPAAVLTAAFGQVVAEIGAALIVGGNIRGQTRTLTTAVALYTSQGDFGMALALGLVLLVLALVVNIALQVLQGRGNG